MRGRLLRIADPTLGEARRSQLVKQLIEARRAVRRDAPEDGRQDALRKVHEAKPALGERGAVWRIDGTRDYNRKMARNTPYAEWFARLAPSKRDWRRAVIRSGKGVAHNSNH